MKSKSSLFLIELIIVILFFSLSGVVCIQLFVKSHTISENTARENLVINHAQNIAELFRGADGDMDTFLQMLADAGYDVLPADTDSDYRLVNLSEDLMKGYCCALVNQEGSDSMASVRIVFYNRDTQDILYDITIEKYRQGGQDNA